MDVMNLFINCKEYFILTEGKEVEDCSDFFTDLPPNKKIEDKYLYGVYDDELLVGAIDLVSNFPEDGEWMIGLVLLHPKVRHIGLGKTIHNVIKDIARKGKAQKLRIGVIEQNTNGYKFWNKIGYKQIKKITDPIKFGAKESKVIVMNYYL